MGRRERRYSEAKEKRDGGTFVPLAHIVLDCRAVRELSAAGAKLLLDLLAQYRGNNNGDLCAAFKLMRSRGWRSEQTLFKARRELEDAGLIHPTRQGARPNRATLYGLTFFALDEHPKLEVTRRSFPRGLWRMKDPIPPLKSVTKNASPTAITEVAAAE